MQITIRFFAGHRDIVGRAELVLAVPAATTVGMIWEQLAAEYPRLAGYTGRMLYAVNQEFATLDSPVHDGDEVAFIPPVSGGTPAAGGATASPEQPYLVTEAPLDPALLTAMVQTPNDGAVVTFAGVVRNHFENRPTAYLVYEAYADMATRVFVQLADEARTRWRIGRVAVHHRIGRLEIGEIAVLVVVAAPHRGAAFEAAAYIMDRIKEVAPIWKQEHWADGEREWRE